MFKKFFSAKLKRVRANRCIAEGNSLSETGDSEGAILLYLKAAELDPEWSVPAYNLGLHYKNVGNWENSLRWSAKAHGLNPDDEGATWNLGIAATALRRWDVARTAWRESGLEIPNGAGELDFPCGIGPVRLDPDGAAEVVWAQRLDPARARILSIPFPESGHHFGDIIVNDGAPVGYRMDEAGREVPVFNSLGVFERSSFSTFAVEVDFGDSEPNLADLERAAEEVEAEVENWTTSLRFLCRACSEGRPHNDHDEAGRAPDGPHRVAIAHPEAAVVKKLISAWALAQDAGATVGEPECVLP